MNQHPNKLSRPHKILVAAASTLLVTGLVWSVRHPQSSAPHPHSERGPASHNVDSHKQKRELDGNSSHQGKAGNGHSITISAKNSQGEPMALPANADLAKYDLVNSRFTLTATITANRHMATHDYAWIFPQTYRVVSGSSVGVLPELKPGQIHTIEISLDRGTEPEQPVVFHAYKLVNSEPRGTVVQFDFPRLKSAQMSKSSSVDLSNESYVQ